MTERYMVKGISIRSKLEYVRDRFGAGAEEQMRSGLKGKSELVPLLDSSWYPYTLYEEINRAIADRFHGGNVLALREVGAYSAEKALTSVYRSFARGTLVDFLGRIGAVHDTYYNQGSMRTEMRPDGRSATVTMTGAASYSEAEAEIATGFLLGAARLLGHPRAACSRKISKEGVTLTISW